MNEDITLLHDTYHEGRAEINTRLGTIAYGDFFCQNASVFIQEILEIWVTTGCTKQEALDTWASNYDISL